jgi:sucrose-6F-phosphate phosphohydrolase
MSPRWILASDIDNTLTGDAQALHRLAGRLARERARQRLFLILSTGRRLEQVMNGFDGEGLPQPDAIISQVGTEIYLPPFSPETRPLAEWDDLLRQQFSRAEAESFLSGIEGLEMQPAKYNTALKVSCYLDGTPDPDAAATLIRERVSEQGKEDRYQVIWSSGRDLDIIPAAAGKGHAIHYVTEHKSLQGAQVVVAGDSGNDRTMFDEFEYGIVVANAQPELKRLAEEDPGPTVYFAQRPYAAGVEEGLEHFGLMA